MALLASLAPLRSSSVCGRRCSRITLADLGEPVCGELLRALRDVTEDPAIASAFEHEPGFTISLLRFSEAKRIYHYRGRRLHREPPGREPLRLSFETSLPGFSPLAEDRHNLLSAMLRVLHDWLDAHDGYGIVATHSPIVLQEIPGRNVRVLRRAGRAPVVVPFDGESFGEGLAEIVNHVFGVDDRNKNYVSVLRTLLDEGMSPEQIESSFGRDLSPNARMALRALSRGAARA